MNTHRFVSPILALALAVSIGAPVALAQPSTAGQGPSLVAAPGDLVPDALLPARLPSGLDLSHDAVSFSWKLPADQALTTSKPYTASSREYWRAVTAAELAAGVPLPTVSAGALVRLQPATAGIGKPIDPNQLVVEKDGAALTEGAAMQLLVTPEQLAAADVPFPEGTTAFRLREELGAGTFTLRAPKATGSEGFVIHVFEPASKVSAELGADRIEYLHGDTLVAHLSLTDGVSSLAVDAVQGVVTSPAGRIFPVTFVPAAGGGRVAELGLDGLEPASQGLWEIQAQLVGEVGGQLVERAVRTAFAVAVPTARFTGAVEVGGKSGQGFRTVTAELPVETAAPGRYEVRGTLYGTDAAGQLLPMAQASSADWLEAGGGVLKLRFHRKVFEGSDLGAPFAVRDLRLVDQGRMGLVERLADGFVIAP
ncbi:MAG: DUF4785 family protein [Acidobacteria bacterium]|nr:DUF4785 family protein [Acidobacteriota bacterium]